MDVKLHVMNIYNPHTVSPEVKTHSLRAYHPHQLFQWSKHVNRTPTILTQPLLR